jgi:hypothetical protein
MLPAAVISVRSTNLQSLLTFYVMRFTLDAMSFRLYRAAMGGKK